ncbi:MAG: alkyl hydroperoxide reductase subunit C [Thiobacillaceae bacterium]|nr:alkyl hydroperoxide reductase subunit C [Thiobacillaceae bacterium]MCX7672722.1 alkyl hydroperoxide reductase subunit C [Thiobacillaceae bacterium]MDW8324444.1 alkyl hydroperoxide reductase subunit C [Burkholderiales bacterium]
MNLIGTEIKPFRAMAYVNGQFQHVSDEDLRGRWSVVFFYPADFTFVCPTELADLAEHYERFQKLGAEIYAVSTDTHYTHKAWHDTSPTIARVRFPMVGDPAGVLARAFGVLNEAEGLAERGSFIIDPQGRIQVVEITASGIGRDARELLRKLEAAQYVAAHPGEVCPAGWQQGAPTLAPSAELVGKL